MFDVLLNFLIDGGDSRFLEFTLPVPPFEGMKLWSILGSLSENHEDQCCDQWVVFDVIVVVIGQSTVVQVALSFDDSNVHYDEDQIYRLVAAHTVDFDEILKKHIVT